MALINQIKSKLLELEGGIFQRLCDDWLFKKGYQNINAIGMTKTSNKTTTGTPDTLISLPDGKYIFSEYTAQQGNLRSKIENDIDKCLDKEKTGISTDEIREIIICYLGELTSADISKLEKKCSQYNIVLTLYNIDTISLSIANDYPILAERYLSISLDTGQILDIDDFIKKYENNEFSTPISNQILFQDELLEKGQQILSKNNFLLISGAAGVGKTLYAVNLVKLIKSRQPSTKIYCIFYKGADLSRDITAYFSEAGEYLIFIDDANRLDSRLDYIFDYLNEINENRKFKIIVTVRNYAKEYVIQKINQIAKYNEISMLPLRKKQIQNLLDEQFNIRNFEYQERIWDISKGNPRIAVMAAKIANETNQFSSLFNIASLYDDYFGKNDNIKEITNNPNLMKTICIICLYRVIDKENVNQTDIIKDIFQINIEDLWKNVNILHKKELVDLYENNIVKISDQILSTYLFYKSLFDQQVITFSILLKRFYSNQRKALFNDALIPVLNCFNNKKIIDKISPTIQIYLEEMIENQHSQEEILIFLNNFWYAIPTTCLIYAKQLIDHQETQKENWECIEFPIKGKEAPEESLIKLLSKFRSYRENEFKIAFDLILELVTKSSTFLDSVIYELINEFGFKKEDYKSGNVIQKIVIDTLYQKCKKGKNYLFSRLFIIISDAFLEAEHIDTSSEGSMVSITRIHLEPNEYIIYIRRKIFEGLSLLIEQPQYKSLVLSIIKNYVNKVCINGEEITKADFPLIQEFILEKLDPKNIIHCKLVTDFLNKLDIINIPYSNTLKNKFNNKVNILLDKLLLDSEESLQLEMNYNEYNTYKEQQIIECLQKLNIDDIYKLFESFNILLNGSINDHLLKNSIGLLISALVKTHSSYVESIINNYIQHENLADIIPYSIINYLLKIKSTSDFLNFFQSLNFNNKLSWLTYYFTQLSTDKITNETVVFLINHFSQITHINEIPQELDFLENYQYIKPNIFVIITEILLKKADEVLLFITPVANSFEVYSNLFNKWFDIYSNKLDIIYKGYLYSLKLDRYFDYQGKALDLLLQKNPDFLYRFVDAIYEKDNIPSLYTTMPNLNFLWERESYFQDIENYGLYIFRKKMHLIDSIFHKLFFSKENSVSHDLKDKQIHFLKETISNNIHNTAYISFIFSIVNLMPYESRLELLLFFLEKNNNFSIFKEIYLFPCSRAWSGSLVPILEKEKEYLLKILTLLNGTTFLEHRAYIEKLIFSKSKEIENEKKRDFLKDNL